MNLLGGVGDLTPREGVGVGDFGVGVGDLGTGVEAGVGLLVNAGVGVFGGAGVAAAVLGCPSLGSGNFSPSL